MAMVETLLTQHIDLWTSAIKRKSSAGRGSSKKIELYGIKKLRELILELAVRGLLVLQDPNDKPASELLKRIAAEKAKLIKEGKIKKGKPLPPITAEEKVFELPNGWEWSKLGTLMEMFNGRAFSQTEWSTEGLPIIRIQNLNDKNAPFNFFNGEISENNFVEPGTFLISWSGTPGTSFGAFIWNGAPGALNQHINKCIIFGDEINREYLRLAVNSCMDHLIENAQGGVGLKHVTKGTLNNCVFAIPPLPEQHRIVAKVDELMALCDQLEQETENSLSAHQTLVETLLNALATSSLQNGGRGNAWQCIADHFDTLFTTEQSIDTLKQTILQLAVMGQLVPQDPNDETASELLKKIAAEKAKFVIEGKIKKEKLLLPPITEEEKPFALPEGWEWERLPNISFLQEGPGIMAKDFRSEGVPLIRIAGVHGPIVSLEGCNFLEEEMVTKKWSHFRLNEGDIILSSSASLGKVSKVGKDTAGSIAYTGLIRFKPYSPLFDEYLIRFFSSNEFARQIDDSKKGAAIMHFGPTHLRWMLVPIPPLPEQHRIVAKVDALMALCDQLKTRLNDTQTTQLHLADAMTEQALAR